MVWVPDVSRRVENDPVECLFTLQCVYVLHLQVAFAADEWHDIKTMIQIACPSLGRT
jgi:hypothetical protein